MTCLAGDGRTQVFRFGRGEHPKYERAQRASSHVCRTPWRSGPWAPISLGPGFAPAPPLSQQVHTAHTFELLSPTNSHRSRSFPLRVAAFETLELTDLRRGRKATGHWLVWHSISSVNAEMSVGVCGNERERTNTAPLTQKPGNTGTSRIARAAGCMFHPPRPVGQELFWLRPKFFVARVGFVLRTLF